jgi:hypothetical protein
MKKMLITHNKKEYIFDINEEQYSILNQECPYDFDDNEFDNEISDWNIEIDNLVIEIIQNTEPFDTIDFNETYLEYFIPKDNYDIVINIIDFSLLY